MLIPIKLEFQSKISINLSYMVQNIKIRFEAAKFVAVVPMHSLTLRTTIFDTLAARATHFYFLVTSRDIVPSTIFTLHLKLGAKLSHYALLR